LRAGRNTKGDIEGRGRLLCSRTAAREGRKMLALRAVLGERAQ